jgi:hypothetical protein
MVAAASRCKQQEEDSLDLDGNPLAAHETTQELDTGDKCSGCGHHPRIRAVLETLSASMSQLGHCLVAYWCNIPMEEHDWLNLPGKGLESVLPHTPSSQAFTVSPGYSSLPN